MSYESDERAIELDYERGDITSEEMHRQMKELDRDYNAAAHEAAEDAYANELDQWFS